MQRPSCISFISENLQLLSTCNCLGYFNALTYGAEYTVSSFRPTSTFLTIFLYFHFFLIIFSFSSFFLVFLIKSSFTLSHFPLFRISLSFTLFHFNYCFLFSFSLSFHSRNFCLPLYVVLLFSLFTVFFFHNLCHLRFLFHHLRFFLSASHQLLIFLFLSHFFLFLHCLSFYICISFSHLFPPSLIFSFVPF